MVSASGSRVKFPLMCSLFALVFFHPLGHAWASFGGSFSGALVLSGKPEAAGTAGPRQHKSARTWQASGTSSSLLQSTLSDQSLQSSWASPPKLESPECWQSPGKDKEPAGSAEHQSPALSVKLVLQKREAAREQGTRSKHRREEGKGEDSYGATACSNVGRQGHEVKVDAGM